MVTKEERKILKAKYLNEGLSVKEMKDRIKNINHLKKCKFKKELDFEREFNKLWDSDSGTL